MECRGVEYCHASVRFASLAEQNVLLGEHGSAVRIGKDEREGLG